MSISIIEHSLDCETFILLQSWHNYPGVYSRKCTLHWTCLLSPICNQFVEHIFIKCGIQPFSSFQKIDICNVRTLRKCNLISFSCENPHFIWGWWSRYWGGFSKHYDVGYQGNFLDQMMYIIRLIFQHSWCRWRLTT